jgi:hypothetical protein
MKAVYWVIPDLLAGRPGPGEVAWDLAELWAVGFRTIVSLTAASAIPIRAAGFRHYRAPLNGGLAFFRLGRRRLARQMLPVVDFVAGEVAAGRPTLVHCRQGRDRTGAVLAAYLIRHRGLSAAEAFGQVRQANPEAMISPGFDRLPELFEPGA